MRHDNHNPYAKVPTKDNFTYVLRDRNGNIKKLWRENVLGRLILRTLRKLVPEPIAAVTSPQGEVTESYVKPGILNYLAAYGLRLPVLTGMYVEELRLSNLVTNAGKAAIASRINGAGGLAAATYLAIGTGTTAAAAAQTALVTEITTGGGARASATASRVTTTVTNDTARLVLTYTFSSTFAVTEAGAFNAVSSGDMFNRQVFSAVNVVSSDTLQVTVDLAVS